MTGVHFLARIGVHGKNDANQILSYYCIYTTLCIQNVAKLINNNLYNNLFISATEKQRSELERAKQGRILIESIRKNVVKIKT